MRAWVSSRFVQHWQPVQKCSMCASHQRPLHTRRRPTIAITISRKLLFLMCRIRSGHERHPLPIDFVVGVRIKVLVPCLAVAVGDLLESPVMGNDERCYLVRERQPQETRVAKTTG